MYKNILVPLDGSKRAEAILPHVEELALRYSAKVILLQIEEEVVMLGHVYAIDFSKFEEEHAQRRKEAESYLAGVAGELREKRINTRKVISPGSVVRSIIDTAEKEGVDLIAMASHGRGGLSRAFYGSVAAGVLQRVDRPLLIIRSRGVK